jgi:hypothetical protein
MHDAKGRLLAEGDVVMIPCVIVSVQAIPDFCNVTLSTLATMPGNNSKSSFTLNTKQVIRANNDDDELCFETYSDGDAVKLR